MEQPNKCETAFDLVLFMNQSKDYYQDVITKILNKAKKFDKGLQKISQYLGSIGQSIQTLED